MIDYHIHPDFSPDAEGRMAELCKRAVEIGVKELCFTTHYEPDPERAQIERVMVGGEAWPVDSDWVKSYFYEIECCQRLFPELKIRAGVEIGYEMGMEGRVADFLSQNRFDFVLGAVHCLDHIAITSGHELNDFRCQLKPKGAEYIAARYFEYIRAAAGSGLFDCLAHLDIWRKIILPELGEGFTQAIGQFIKPMVDLIAQTPTGLEINTAALRRGEKEPYPAQDIINQAVGAGIRTWTIGSDCHRVQDLGAGLEMAKDILMRYGLEPVRFKRRQKV
ncbi:MAG: histidinol-phosphatase HisJ family protein [bacterium]